MPPTWLQLAPTIAIHTLVILAIATAAARIRFSASKTLRRVLDVLFLLPLALPMEFVGGIYQNITLIEAGAMLPILYLGAIVGFRSVKPEVLDAARLQGMGLCGTFWRFFIPSAKYWLLGGAALVVFRQLLVMAFLLAHAPGH